jgi:hypothetical protein
MQYKTLNVPETILSDENGDWNIRIILSGWVNMFHVIYESGNGECTHNLMSRDALKATYPKVNLYDE